jgi:hypothetical protein
MNESEAKLLAGIVQIHLQRSPDPDTVATTLPIAEVASATNSKPETVKRTLATLAAQLPKGTLALEQSGEMDAVRFTPGNIIIHPQDARIALEAMKLTQRRETPGNDGRVSQSELIRHLVEQGIGEPEQLAKRLKVLTKMGYLSNTRIQ